MSRSAASLAAGCECCRVFARDIDQEVHMLSFQRKPIFGCTRSDTREARCAISPMTHFDYLMFWSVAIATTIFFSFNAESLSDGSVAFFFD